MTADPNHNPTLEVTMYEYIARTVARNTESLLTELTRFGHLEAFAETVGRPEFKLPGTVREVAIALVVADKVTRMAAHAARQAEIMEAFSPSVDEQNERELWASANELDVVLELPSHELLERWLPTDPLTRVYKLEEQSRRGLLTYRDHLHALDRIFGEIVNADDAIAEDWSRWLRPTHEQCIKRAIYLDVNRRSPSEPTT